MGKNLPRFSYLLLPLFFISFQFANAQNLKTEEIRKRILSDTKVASVEISPEKNTASFIMMKNGSSYSKADAGIILLNYLQLRNGVDNLSPVKNIVVQQNLEVQEFQQYFRGIKVDYGNFKALIKNGQVSFFNGSYYDVPLTLSTHAVISETEALSFARKMIHAKEYAWETVQKLINQANDPKAISALQKELQEYLPKGELVIIKDFTRRGAIMRLAYKFNIYATEPLSRGWVYVDAENGKILLYNSILKDFEGKKKRNTSPNSTNSTVTTRYAGTQTIKVKQVSGNDPNSGNVLVSSHPSTGSDIGYVPGSPTYVLMDDTRGNGIETYDLNGVGGLPISVAGIYTQGKSFTDVDNNWTLAEHKRSPGIDGAQEAENDDIAWDAHWGAETVYDYWITKQNRLSYDGNNAKIKSFIHYGPAYDNAFWNGSVMTYGDGSGPAAGGFHALTSLDVCGHEIGHGVCSSTSDLVYASESGAMNEALSDIWASCIEHFAMTRAGSTVPSGIYRPFYIGEQIGLNYDNPLRRMDNPKQLGDPDTYGGINWRNPNCSPNLVNDECGVHTNSGVLNKWFFLITAGSVTGTRGPGTSSYYFLDSDDGINDLGNSYIVNGLGFDVSERVTFLTETLLSATATYSEARTVSISVAKALTGDNCSGLVQTITNAWYAVGVGAAFASPCTTTFGFVFQPGYTLTESALGTGCNDGKTFFVPVLLPANSSATFSTGGTATLGQDYTLSTTTLVNSTGADKNDTLSVFIKNDAVVENNETINLTVSITNTGSNPVNTSYTITIIDDDVTPVIGSDSVTLINETFTGADGFADPPGWTEILEIPEGTFNAISNPTPNGKNQWGIFNNQLAITGKVFATNATMPGGTYNDLSESRTIIRSSLIDGRGLNTAVIHFDYTVQGEVDLTSGSTDPETFPVFDYMAVVYSFDGVNFTELTSGQFKPFASPNPTSGSFTGTLPSILNNKQFYIGFRWYNDGNAGGPVSVDIDNLTLKMLPRKIENDLFHSGNEKIGPNQEVYIYSQNDGQLVSKTNNASSNDFQCTTMSIEHTGNSTFSWYNDGTNTHRVADKIVHSTATSNNLSSNYTINLYFSEQQIAALEAITGLPRTLFKLYHTTANAYTGATGANTTNTPATYTAIPGTGGVFSASFNGGLSGSFALGAPLPQAPLPVTCLDFRVAQGNNSVTLNWKVGDETNNNGFAVERSVDGRNFEQIGFVRADIRNNGQYNFIDNNISGLQQAYYRLKQTDISGEYHYLCTVLFVRLDGRDAFVIGKIYPNPSNGNGSYVNITTSKIRKLKLEYVSASGQLVDSRQVDILPGTSRIELKLRSLAQGTYLVRFRDEQNRIIDAQSLIIY